MTINGGGHMRWVAGIGAAFFAFGAAIPVHGADLTPVNPVQVFRYIGTCKDHGRDSLDRER